MTFEWKDDGSEHLLILRTHAENTYTCREWEAEVRKYSKDDENDGGKNNLTKTFLKLKIGNLKSDASLEPTKLVSCINGKFHGHFTRFCRK